uniref:thiol oxidase n=1 Tax=viral metagenome TaxID=1070528 RepID=A0A6C0ASJ3_9ZZZZ
MNLQFINARTQGQYKNRPFLMMASIPLPTKKSVMNVATQSNPENQPKKVVWGEPTWFLFHTLAEKVKEENFDQIKTDLLNHIKSICNVLPCPICAEHATKYMQQVQINSIRTKDDLKLLLFRFHNHVNAKKGYLQFPLDNLDDKYSKANTNNIINYFLTVFQKKSNNVTAIASDMYKTRILQLFKNWLSVNIQYFDS